LGGRVDFEGGAFVEIFENEAARGASSIGRLLMAA
jgi:hypothetical protein